MKKVYHLNAPGPSAKIWRSQILASENKQEHAKMSSRASKQRKRDILARHPIQHRKPLDFIPQRKMWENPPPPGYENTIDIVSEQPDGYLETIYYLANFSNDVISRVSKETGGFATSDDDLITVSSKPTYFENVLPGEAVPVEIFDPIFDSDFVLSTEITVEMPTGERKKMEIRFGKGAM